MSASTSLNLSDLVAHVPVDNFEIHNGPSQARCLQVMEELSRGTVQEPHYAEQVFTLATLASNSLFRRTLKLAAIFAVKDNGTFNFTAIFCGRVVSGVYDPRVKRGYFNLD